MFCSQIQQQIVLNFKPLWIRPQIGLFSIAQVAEAHVYCSLRNKVEIIQTGGYSLNLYDCYIIQETLVILRSLTLSIMSSVSLYSLKAEISQNDLSKPGKITPIGEKLSACLKTCLCVIWLERPFKYKCIRGIFYCMKLVPTPILKWLLSRLWPTFLTQL